MKEQIINLQYQIWESLAIMYQSLEDTSCLSPENLEGILECVKQLKRGSLMLNDLLKAYSDEEVDWAKLLSYIKQLNEAKTIIEYKYL